MWRVMLSGPDAGSNVACDPLTGAMFKTSSGTTQSASYPVVHWDLFVFIFARRRVFCGCTVFGRRRFTGLIMHTNECQ